MKRSEITFSAILLPVDILAILLGFWLSYYLRNSYTLISPEVFGSYAAKIQYFPGYEMLPADKYWHYVIFIVPLMILTFAFIGLYDIRLRTPWYKRFVQILLGVTVGEFAILLMFLVRKDFFLPRSIILYSWTLCTLIVLIGRYLVYRIQVYLRRYNIGIIRVGFIGDINVSKDVMKHLKKMPFAGYKMIYKYDNVNEPLDANLINRENIDELIVTSDHFDNEQLILLRNICLEEHIAFTFVPSLFTELPVSYELSKVAGLPMVEVKSTPLDGWGKILKRLFDLVLSLVFIVLFSPFFIIISILLKLTSKGPLIYKHERIGYHKEKIYIWKFRSMIYKYCVGCGQEGEDYFKELLDKNSDLKEEWGRDHKLKNDPRVSRIGKLLRKTSLDELPQFFNVLLGTISMVGPRPITTKEVDKYGDRARILFTVKPGLTGLWQVSGRSDASYKERTDMDTKYIENWNIWTDIYIVLATGTLFFKRGGDRGAY